jgi:hypothetical protein
MTANKTFSIRSMTRATAIAVALALGATAPAMAADDVEAPTYAVGGLASPAAGVLEITIHGTDGGGAGLLRAAASLGGGEPVEARFGDESCVPAGTAGAPQGDGCPSTGVVTLEIDTTKVADGEHALDVTVEDAAGNAAVRVDRKIEVNNTLEVWRSTVVVTVGAGALEPVPVPPGGGTPPGGGQGGPACNEPRLSMSLADRPLRFRRGVPVLAGGRRYLFRGRLTCIIGGKRRAAPPGVVIAIRSLVRGRGVAKPPTTVGRKGQIKVRLRFYTRRVVVFRVRGAAGELVRVRIPILVTKVPRGRR